jgi:hypothetical protein
LVLPLTFRITEKLTKYFSHFVFKYENIGNITGKGKGEMVSQNSSKVKGDIGIKAVSGLRDHPLVRGSILGGKSLPDYRFSSRGFFSSNIVFHIKTLRNEGEPLQGVS